jgi:glutamyl/glutaminyl-tRNA synthetase
LRIEDTDQARSSDESARGIMEDLAWLGIEWDEGPELQWTGATGAAGTRTIGGDPRGVGPFFQARRVALYNKYLMQLVEQGKAYPAFEKSEELEAKRQAAVKAKQTYRYDRAAVREMPEVRDRIKRMESGEPHVVRLMAPAGEIVVHDQVLGDVRYAPGELDDFVLRKADGFPTYHFAVVIDDETMGITHVMRAQEHLNNTPRHVAIQGHLGFRTPVYGHMPLIFNMDATKMSKRDKAKAARAALKAAIKKDPTLDAAKVVAHVRAHGTGAVLDVKEVQGFLDAENDSLAIATAVAQAYNVVLPEIEVADFRDNGYSPEAICNFLGLLGWNPGMKLPDGRDLEKFDRAFLAQHFSIERIGRTNAKFDRQKLLSFNADIIAAMSDEAYGKAWREWCMEHDVAFVRAMDAKGARAWALMASLVKPRAKTIRDGMKAAAFVVRADDATDFDPAATEKNLTGNDLAGLKLLREVREMLAAAADFEPGTLHALLETAAKSKGFVTEKGVNVGPIAQPLRVAIAGVAVTPQLGESLAILGRESTLKRLDTCLRVLGD